MTISIAMCTYNGARFLNEQLLSIRAQTAQPFELVICDDGSTDATSTIVESFRSLVFFPVRFYQNIVNIGSTKNFEQAIRLCRGEFIALCDQDDIWNIEKLETMKNVLLAKQGLAGAFCNATLIDENGLPMQGSLWQRSEFTRSKQERFSRVRAPYSLIDRDTVTGATLMFRSRYVEQILPIPLNWVHDGWIALILASVAEIQPLPSCLMSYRLHASQQIGAQKVPWYRHLYTRKGAALASHAQMAKRFQQVYEKLVALHADRKIVTHLARKVFFLKRRIADLEKPRSIRFFSVPWKLRDYTRFERGVMSILRDLTH